MDFFFAWPLCMRFFGVLTWWQPPKTPKNSGFFSLLGSHGLRFPARLPGAAPSRGVGREGGGQLHPGRLTWNIIMEVWKMIFLSKWVICRFHVNLPGCNDSDDC